MKKCRDKERNKDKEKKETKTKLQVRKHLTNESQVLLATHAAALPMFAYFRQGTI
ncbi:hypothetical protein O181_128899, partial [Austropuccinia psidii MF-1]|nr:hypothetical protein [Austropuccinia psidii MF-1]